MTRGALILAVLPAAVQAQLLDCAPPTDALAKLPAVATAVTLLDKIFPDIAAALGDSVAEVCLTDPPFGALGYFDADARRIVLAEGLSDGLQQAVFFHELRHARQFDFGACPTPKLSMHDYAEAIFLMEADASVTTVLIADALRDLGDPRMWHALAAWPMQADILSAFEASRTSGSGLPDAAAAAFAAWYSYEPRREAYYVGACSDYLDWLDRENLIPHYGTLEDDFFDAFCVLPDGTPYPCARPDPP